MPNPDAKAACRAALLKACRQMHTLGPRQTWVPVDDAAACMAEREAKLERVRAAAVVMVCECAYLFERHGAETTEALQERGLGDALAYRALCAALAAAQGGSDE